MSSYFTLFQPTKHVPNNANQRNSLLIGSLKCLLESLHFGLGAFRVYKSAQEGSLRKLGTS